VNGFCTSLIRKFVFLQPFFFENLEFMPSFESSKIYEYNSSGSRRYLLGFVGVSASYLYSKLFSGEFSSLIKYPFSHTLVKFKEFF
jgi:hypothetical protein